MATSGISTFDPAFDDILQDAVAMVGGGPVLAEELISAKRGLNYLLTSIQNQNILLHKVETTNVPVSASVGSLNFDQTILDVLKVAVKVSTTEIIMDRDGYERWAEIPVKTQPGRPMRYWFDRERTGSRMDLWPVPNRDYTLVITMQKAVEDTVRAFDSIDVPRRFLPAIVYGLAYWIGLRRGARVPDTRLTFIKAQYEAELKEAMREDRERGSIYIRIGR